MRTLAALAIAGLIATTIGTRADGTDSFMWKKVGEWEIRVDPTVNNGCFMMGVYTRGDVFRVGFNRQDSNGYIIIANDSWKSLVIGNKYPLEIQFDANSPWNGDALAFEMSSAKVLMVKFSSPEMMKELSTSEMVTFKYNGNLVSKLPLTGVKAAVDELIHCQNVADSQTPKADPFASGSQTSGSDPFKQ